MNNLVEEFMLNHKQSFDEEISCHIGKGNVKARYLKIWNREECNVSFLCTERINYSISYLEKLVKKNEKCRECTENNICDDCDECRICGECLDTELVMIFKKDDTDKYMYKLYCIVYREFLNEKQLSIPPLSIDLSEHFPDSSVESQEIHVPYIYIDDISQVISELKKIKQMKQIKVLLCLEANKIKIPKPLLKLIFTLF